MCRYSVPVATLTQIIGAGTGGATGESSSGGREESSARAEGGAVVTGSVVAGGTERGATEGEGTCVLSVDCPLDASSALSADIVVVKAGSF